ncbi:MAG: hypoxanthine phosphoribosyltransferase [Firmicutes bacterium]|nr:hypoxanthine phosphoribosyltransferase [Bacillota bacterium]
MIDNKASFAEMEKDIAWVLADEETLKAKVAEMGREITDYYLSHPVKKKLLVVGILKGSVVFMSDLIRQIGLPLQLEFMKVSSYGHGTKSTGVIEIKLAIEDEILEDADVLVVEDILDSGNTLAKVMEYLKHKGAASVRLCTLLDKPDRRKADIKVDFEGIIIPDEFVVGYGLDFAEKYRNLPYVGVLKPEVYE